MIALVTVLAFAAAPAGADTVYFKDGSIVDAKVGQYGKDSYSLLIDGGRMIVPRDDVDRIRFDRAISGRTDGPVQPRDERLIEQTGLRVAEQDRIKSMLHRLNTKNANEFSELKLEFLALHKKTPIFDYLSLLVPFVPSLAPNLLDVLATLEPGRMRGMLAREAANADAAMRLRALKLLEKIGSDADAEIFARGLLDKAPEVRIECAAALAKFKSLRATPVLIQTMRSDHPGVRGAARNALAAIWIQGVRRWDYATPDEWTAHWRHFGAGVQGVLDPKQLRPLTEPPDDAPPVPASEPK